MIGRREHITQRSRSRRMVLVGLSYSDWLSLQDGLPLRYKLDETGGLVALATNDALALGRNVVINGSSPITFTGDDPDNWVVTEPINTEVTERGTGQLNAGGGTGAMNFFNSVGTSNRPVASQTIVYAGKSYKYTVVISAYASGQLQLNVGPSNDFNVPQSVGTHIINATAITTGNLDVRLEAAGDITVDSITQEQTGILASKLFPGAEELNEAGASGTATAANWGGTVCTNPSVGILQNAHIGSNNPRANQAVLTIGVTYEFNAEARSDGNATPQVDNAVSSNEWIGTTSTDWQEATGTFVATATTFIVRSNTTTLGQYTEWRNLSVKPANPLNLTNTGLAPGQAGAGNIPLIYTGDGTTGRLFSASIAEYNSMINLAAGGLISSVSASTWAAGVDVLHHSGVDATNFIEMRRNAATLEVEYQVGGVGSVASFDTSTLPNGSPTEMFNFDCRWTAPGTIDLFYNGVEQDSTAIATAIVGNLDPALTAWFAANSSGGNSFAGGGGELGLLTSAQDDLFYIEKNRRSGL